MSNVQKQQADFGGIVKGKNYNCAILLSPHNKRITVSDFHVSEDSVAVREMVEKLTAEALNYRLDKIWLKTTATWVDNFREAGFKLEATIPGFYEGRQATYLISLFLTPERGIPSAEAEVGKQRVIASNVNKQVGAQPHVDLHWGTPEHCEPLAKLYGKVFATYPFPVSDPTYIKRTMSNNVHYITAWQDNKLVAAASAEMAWGDKNAEMTDFATLPEYRSMGLAKMLLQKLENYLLEREFNCLYTIARSSSVAMNKTFYDSGYVFCGVLVNNCNIAGNFEDMNVLSKNI